MAQFESNEVTSGSEIREVFNSYDSVGDEKIHVKQIGEVLRTLDLNPTEEDIKKYMGFYNNPDNLDTRISYEDFICCYQIARKDYKPLSIDEIVEGLSHFDKEGNGMINVAELRHILTTLGERLTDNEVDKLIDGNADSNGNLYIAEFVKQILELDIGY
uniref:Myosin-2 essential light chain n=1 Tax=Rhabditophanes sp. KR3021 TaxID=114890 RepID=A0AC35U4T7_9BILA